MRLGAKIVRAAFGLFAAMLLAASSLVAPVSELTEEMHHASLHAATAGDHVAHDDANGEPRGAKHSHPDTPGHTHCGAVCHIQISDARFAFAVTYVAAEALFVPLIEDVLPAAHLDGLFRPPRA